MTMPSEPAAEKSVIGAGLLGVADQAKELLAMLDPPDFYDRLHELIWQAMQEVAAQGLTVDPYTVESRMTATKTMQVLSVRGGLVYLTDLALAATLYTAADHAKLVREAANLRRLILWADGLRGSARDRASFAELLASAQRDLGDMAKLGTTRPAKDLKVLVNGSVKRVAERTHNKRAVPGVPSGLTDLDARTGGFRPGHLNIIAGRPGMGKTAFTFGAMLHAAEQGYPGLFFSMEMDEEETADRGMTHDSRVDSSSFQRGYLGTLEWKRIFDSAARLSEYRLRVDDNERQTLASIENQARLWRSDPAMFPTGVETGVIGIDYLQLIKTPGSRHGQSRRHEEIGDITKGLKALAKELRVPILLLSQLNRGLENRADKRPANSDLKESGSIEEDANLILLLYRDEVYNSQTEDTGIAEIIIGKGRHCGTGTIKARFFEKCTRFDNLSMREPL